MGPTVFDQLIKDKVVAINGDLLDDNLGLAVKDHETLVKHVNVILHCGGNTDGNERLDISVKINAAGTNALINLANECDSLSSFVHLSPLKTYGSSSIPFDRVGILPEESSVEDIIDHILGSNLEDLPSILSRARPYYQNAHTFSKALAEQVLVSDARKKKIRNSPQLPVGILRLGHIGPSVSEPLKGWADDVNGVNGVILLTGRGTRIIDTGHGEMAADVIPVDFAVRTILSCAFSMNPPPSGFTLPMTDDTRPDIIPEKTSSTPALGTNRDSSSSYSSIGTTATSTAANTITATTEKHSTIHLTMDCFPYIYHVSALDMRAISWRLAYEAIRHYWTRATGVNLSPSNSYFTASAQGFSRARTVMNSLRSVASSVYMTNTNNGTTNGDSTARPSNKRSSHRMSRYVDKAARLSPNVMRTYTTLSNTSNGNNNNNNKKSPLVISSSSTFTGGPWMKKLKECMQRNISSGDDSSFDPYFLVPEDADTAYWMDYFSNASYGMHYFVGAETNVRLPTPAIGWNCALQFIGAYGSSTHDVIDYQVGSELHSPDQVNKRMYRMIDHLKHLLVQDDIPPSPQQRQQNQQQHDEGWGVDMDDSLEDWCQDQMVLNAEQHDKRAVLGKWRKKVGSNDDAVKVVVLNDKRVNQAIHQITRNAGVSKQTAVNEAMKILVQMSERTQLTFVWFTGSFLKSFFDHMFESIRISEDSIRYIRDSTLGKRVVYVPVSKSILDPLLVWYITIRYHLPVPALVCDEVMAQLGPISDIYRLAGAYYVKRDKAQRSPLNSAVTAAYSQVLLREHGALSMCLEKSRSRTGKYQEAFDDEVIDMVMESTLQSNQSRSSAVSKVAAYDSVSPPASPDSPATPVSATMSMDSSTGIPRKAHRDVVIVPINISYEIVPELGFLIDQVLDQQPRSVYMGPDSNSAGGKGSIINNSSNYSNGYMNTGGRSSPLLASTQAPSSPLPSVVRPSQTMDKRNRLLDGIEAPKKCGRVHVGIGSLVSVQEVAAGYNKTSTSQRIDEKEFLGLAGEIVKRTQSNQMKALVVTPLTLVCATILYGRATGGVCLGKIKELLEWLRQEILDRQYSLDWQDGEDLESIIFSVFRLINEPKNLIIEGKELTDDTNIRVNDHADNIMALSYYSNQMVNIFLLDSFFAVVYLSFSEDTVTEDEFMDRFRFLVQLLEKEFVLTWNIVTQFKAIVSSYEKSGVIRRKNKDQLSLLVTMETNHLRYEQLIFLASLIYPTIDTYWITSCSLSALECVPTLPRSIVPLLSQWIATHLITGRRTIYREVLSTESSRMAVDVFMSMGFLTEFQAKEKLSPDAQILLHELKIPTTETLIELTGQNSDGGMTPVSPIDPEGMMKALMAQIQMNRANSNMADLCQQIDSYRLGAASQRESFQNAQVFQKCLKQIKGILQAGVSFAKKRKVDLDDTEDGMIQLVYVLRANSMASNNDRLGHGRALRRISEAYNLK
ncbi:unnamed protein product [Absidia cylindrospora]